MKTIFVHARSKLDVLPVIKKIKAKKKFGLLTTVQHLHTLDDVKKVFPDSVVGGQVLGCDVSAAKKINSKVDAFLFIGSGEFHPLQIVRETGKDVYCADPYTLTVRIISKSDLENQEKKTRGAFLKFMNADKIGILVSLKSGQNNLKVAEDFKKETKKETFIFLFDTLDFSELENFPDIECWVNTACPRIGYDDSRRISKPVINLDDLKKLL
ncbi:MAG: diphthamide synthesis protein [archaeon]